MKIKAITTKRDYHVTTICMEDMVVEVVDTGTVELVRAPRKDQAEGLQVNFSLWLEKNH